MQTSASEALTYLGKEPNVSELKNAYNQTVLELESYFDQCRNSYDDRRNFWPGKSRDLRKHGADAFPWDGASDMESHVIEERIGRLVSLLISSLKRANVRAFPVEGTDAERAKIVSSFLKWMISSGYISRFMREMELGANYLLERGLLITYVGWMIEDRRIIQKLDLDQIVEAVPEIAVLIDEEDDEPVIQKLQAAFDGVTDARAKKALKDLRKTGYAELPTVKRSVDAPEVKTLSPDGDFFFPSYVTDPQRSPYCFWRTYYTPQELENKILTDDWDADFVENVIKRYSGVNQDSIETEQEYRRGTNFKESSYESNELIEIIWCYQRLVDPDDGAEGIYRTIFHREMGSSESSQYAKFELMNGYDDYPVVVTRLAEDSKRLYDTTTIPDLLRGIQNQVKVERDSRIDRNSLCTLPPIMHPVNQPPQDWGPGRYIPRRRAEDYEFADTPGAASLEGSIEMEKTQLQQADRLTGLDEDSEISKIKKQFLVDKFLEHCAEVMQMCFTCFQRFGPDFIFFRVTGVPDPQEFTKGKPNENFDITISYDSINSDPETQEAKLKQLVDLVKLDRNGRINVDNLLIAYASSVDPILADSILQKTETASEEVQKDILDDLSKIFAGIEMPARSNGGAVATQIIQNYMQQPDIAQRMQQDQSFGQRMQKYMQQYTFQEQQQVNATQFGIYGTEAASVGEVQTQKLEG
tara:strand:+ start:1876 stop:3966 length:2091 start_codon:yes stop_codon:yes gene_type:complete